MTGRPGFHSPEYEKKRALVGAVIDFNDANSIVYSRLKVFKHFGVSKATGYAWFPAGSQQRWTPKKHKNPKASPNPKRARAEDPDEQASPNASDSLTPAPRRQNPVRNDGRGRKRLKEMVMDVMNKDPLPSESPSTSPTPEPLLTPSKPSGQPAAQKPIDASEGQQNRDSTPVMDTMREDCDEEYDEDIEA